MRLYVVAGKVTDSVTYGFLPAARRLGLEVIVLTDRPGDHRAAYPQVPVVGCEVTDYREIIAGVSAPDAIFSNSDHLQAATALAAAYHGLPGKDWRACVRAKNKALMRRHLADLDPVYTADPEALGGPVPFPVVLKPREGVASEDVFLVRSPPEMRAQLAEIRARRADPLVIEEYLPGALHTLETLDSRVLGSFRTQLSPPPHFTELRMDWAPPPAAADHVLACLRRLGIGFGACHTEFVVHEGRARLIEVNYRIVGDHADFLLSSLLGQDVFETVLRAHLGLPPLAPAAPVPAGTVDYVLADRSGTLTAAPGPADTTAGGVRLTYRPHRAVGDQIRLTRTNRDFLGAIEATGPSRPAVDAALTAFRASHSWTIE